MPPKIVRDGHPSSLSCYKSKKIHHWTPSDVCDYLTSRSHEAGIIQRMTKEHQIDGRALLLLTEMDLRDVIGVKMLGPLKNLMYDIISLQRSTKYRRKKKSLISCSTTSEESSSEESEGSRLVTESDETEDIDAVMAAGLLLGDSVGGGGSNGGGGSVGGGSDQHFRRPISIHARNLKPEVFKAFVAMFYLFVVTWITALVMVIVHDRVPDMEKYPPLPDLFLDHVPHIPWAFEMCEVTGFTLLVLWFGVLFFHKHRFILLRRFFALSGTVFLLRCVTMLITSLSVPGAHLKCNPRPYGDWMNRLYNAYLIWKGAGMSIQGVRTCGDYMFSGHTVALTMLNFFVTEYTTRRIYLIHTFSWLLNTFGIFFILAAHEHYSIDVFIAFYITSRLFLYYHTLANNQALMQRDSKRTKVWFPLFSYFESGIDGIVPNQYEWPITPRRIKRLVKLVSLTLQKKFEGKFFVSKSSSVGFFRTKVNAFIKPMIFKNNRNNKKE